MPFHFVSATARAAWAAATTQQAQLEGLRDEWAGQMSVRYYSSADAHLATVTHETPIVDTSTTPYSLKLGAYAAQTDYSVGVAAYCVLAVPAGADILRADCSLAGPGGAVTNPGGRVRLDIGATLRVQATSTLPLADTPAWLSGASVNEWISISGTGSPTGLALDAFCGWAFKADTNDIYAIAPGGHLNSSDNRVGRLRLSDNTPAWTTVNSASASVTDNAPYNPDGKPAARHTYHNAGFWISAINRIMLVGARDVYGADSSAHNTVDGYNPSNDTWDAGSTYASGDVGLPASWNNDGTWANITTAGYIGVAVSTNGTVLCLGGRKKWVNNVMSGAGSYDSGSDVAYCFDWDTDLNVFFGLSIGPGIIGGTGTRCYTVTESLSRTDVTLSGSGLAQFEADQCEFSGMDYDQTNGWHLFYSGNNAGTAGRVYKIVMTGASTATITEYADNGALPQSDTGGINSKFTYVPEYQGFLAMPSRTGGCYFMRTA